MKIEHLILKLAGNFVAILFVSYGFQGINVATFSDALLAALILGVINVSIKPMILLVTLPFNILSLGLLTLFINAFMLKVVAWIIPGFSVSGFLTALFGALTISIISLLITIFVPSRHEENIHRW